MSDDSFLKIHLSMMLSTEDFHGPYHKGNKTETVPYMLESDIKLFEWQGSTKWMQIRHDANQRFDDRIPGNGPCVQKGGNLELLAADGTKVFTCEGLNVESTSSGRGLATFDYFDRAYQKPKYSDLRWRGKGTWSVAQRNEPVQVRYLTSGWTYDTSAGSGGGLLISAGGGMIGLKDPNGTYYELYYGGLGVGAGWKRLPKVTGGGATKDFWSTGKVFKNPVLLGARELTKEDFVGECAWVDASIAAVILGIGVACFIFNVVGVMPFKTGYAFVPTIGRMAGVSAGGGAYGGRVKGAW